MCGNLKILGLVGASSAGKSTLSKVLEEHGYVRLALGKPFKDMLAVLGLTKNDLYGPPSHRSAPNDLLCGKSPRFAMISIAQDWGRKQIGNDIWVNALQNQIVAYQTKCATEGRPALIVVEDVRQPNEWDMIHRLGGSLWRVRRPEVEPKIGWLCRLCNAPVRWQRMIGKALVPLAKPFGLQPVHETEYHWPDAPAEAEFWNTGTTADLEAQVRDFLARCAPTCEGTAP